MDISVLDIVVQVFSPAMMSLALLGTTIGIIFGAIPGLNGVIGITLLLPLTFGFPPQAGLLMLGGLYMGATYGGSITAILINVPGTPEATFTAVEGFQMTKKGLAQEALYFSIYSCIFGGLIGVIILIYFTPFLASLAVKFGPPEMFLLAVSGLAIVGSLAGSNMPKAFFATGLGLMISFIGADIVSSAYRFTFGNADLKGGIPTIPVLLGVFAISEMFLNLGNKTGKITLIEQVPVSRISVLKRFFAYKWALFKATIIGSFIGILPGVGSTIAAFVAYGNAKATSKTSALYGKGNPEGIIVNESANNAVCGTSLVPLLSLGIPGSATAAVMFGALTIHGIIPGPDLFSGRADVAYSFMYGMLLTIVFMGIIGIYGLKLFSYIVKIKLEYIIPITMSFSLFGAYCYRNNMFDVLLTLIFGVFGIILKKTKIPFAPYILGMVLGQLIEMNFRLSLVLAKSDSINLLLFYLKRPLCVILLVFLTLMIYMLNRINKKAQGAGTLNSEKTADGCTK